MREKNSPARQPYPVVWAAREAAKTASLPMNSPFSRLAICPSGSPGRLVADQDQALQHLQEPVPCGSLDSIPAASRHSAADSTFWSLAFEEDFDKLIRYFKNNPSMLSAYYELYHVFLWRKRRAPVPASTEVTQEVRRSSHFPVHGLRQFQVPFPTPNHSEVPVPAPCRSSSCPCSTSISSSPLCLVSISISSPACGSKAHRCK